MNNRARKTGIDLRLGRLRRAVAVASMVVLVSTFLGAPGALAQNGDQAGSVAQNGDAVGTVAGRVTDPDGVPLAGILVTVNGSCAEGVICEIARATTESDGRYRIAPLLGAITQVVFSDPLLRYGYLVRTDLGEVDRHEQVTGFDATLQPSSTISGRVVLDGAGFPGATVMVRVTGPNEIPLSTTSDASGAFTLAGLPPAFTRSLRRSGRSPARRPPHRTSVLRTRRRASPWS